MSNSIKKYNKFSIIIPIFLPYKEFIANCINSIKNQTFNSYECILVVPNVQLNDFLNMNLNLDKRFIVINSDSTSQSVNRNVGIKVAKGDYLIFVDCDDTMDKNFLTVCLNDIFSEDPDIIILGYTRNEKDIGNFYPNIITKTINLTQEINKIFYSCFNGEDNITNALIDSSCCKAYKREIIVSHNILFDELTTSAEDALFVRDFGIYVQKATIHENYLSYYWRYNDKSSMNNLGPFFDINQFCKHLDQINMYKKFNEITFNNYKINVLNSRIDRIINLIDQRKISLRCGFIFIKTKYKNSYVSSSLIVNRNTPLKTKCVIKNNFFIFFIYLLFFCIYNKTKKIVKKR